MCGISAGSICWFSCGNTLHPDYINAEVNKIEGLGFYDVYLSPHCNYEGKRDSEIRSLEHIDKIGISLSNYVALEIIDNQYRLIKADGTNYDFELYGLKSYSENGEFYEEKIDDLLEFKPLDELLSKNVKSKNL